MKTSQRIATSRPLATTAMHGRVEDMRHAGQHVIDFSIAISHFPAPAAVRKAIADSIAHERTMPYTGVSGALPVRERLCAKLAAENRIQAAPSEIVVTNGAKQALYEALYVMADPGARVLVFRPYWPAYLATCQLLGLRPVTVDLSAEITPALLETIEPVEILILNNPHNPTGKVFTRAELELLCDWAGRTGAQVIVDESYEHLGFGAPHTSLAALCDWRALGVVTIFSASQNYAMMGWRIGFALAPETIARAMATLQGPITAAVAYPAQVATAAAFASGPQAQMLADYRERRDLVVRRMRDVPWIAMHAPASGPYLWGDVRALGHDSVAFAEELLAQEQVAVMPGDALGMPGFIRIGYIADDVATLMEGVRRLIAFGDRLAARP